ncbi:MAG: alpha-amylase family glycosyl hydrolase [Bacilli bacterium]|jgi:glycosidase|nr:alpha-amylase family glycosyl hydrolase [Bacilli bacterium]
MKSLWTILITTLSVLTLVNPFQKNKENQKQNNEGIIVHYRGDYPNPHIHYWDIEPSGLYTPTGWPGEKLIKDANDWYTKEFIGVTSIKLIFNNGGQPQTSDLSRTTGEWWYLGQGSGGKWYAQDPDTIEETSSEEAQKINLHVKSTLDVPKILYYDSLPAGTKINLPTNMFSETNNWYRYGFHKISSIKVKITFGTTETKEYYLTNGEWYLKDGILTSFKPNETSSGKSDFREETIYFLLTARFYDGDQNNNVHCWDDRQAQNPDTDPAWRGDFKGLIEKLDYIKALGFSAIWISPVVENASGYDYHGYHALDFSQIDPRLESPYATYQDLINEAHARDMKIIQDVVFNHTGNFGEKNIYPLFEKDYRKEDTVSNLIKTDPNNLLPSNYESLNGGQQYGARIDAMKEDHNDANHIYHHEKSLGWEEYNVQTAQIAGDCVDLNTENPYVTNYLIDAYNRYIDMGVDGFRVDTVKHISRLVFNQEFNPAFMAKGGENFFMFGEVATRVREVWNHGIPAISTPFYTWKETKTYPWATREEREASVKQNWDDNNNVSNQPTSNNHYLDGNNYRQVDYSKKSDMNVIDFPMHWNFKNAYDAFNLAKSTDHVYSDATWNVTYIDSHDYAPDGAPEGERFNQHQNVWAENLSLIFTFRGIPTLYYGSEIEFQKGKRIDVGPNDKLSNTGRAYFGDHIEGNLNVTDFGKYTNASGQIATTLNHPLAKHVRSLNLIRRGIPALQKGQYSVSDLNGGLSYKRRYSDDKTDSFALISVSNGATFYNIPNGTYVDAVTGHTMNVTNNTLSISLNTKGNLRVYVLNTAKTPAPGKLAEVGTYLN